MEISQLENVIIIKSLKVDRLNRSMEMPKKESVK